MTKKPLMRKSEMSTEKETYQADRVLDHDYDGIQEYDNRLPNWWLWALWATIVFSIGYWLVFHTYGVAKNPVAKFETEIEGAAPSADLSARGLTEADLVRMSTNQEVLAAGKAVYAQYCQVCHLAAGQGLVGPNLTDDYWIHGGSAVAIHEIIVQRCCYSRDHRQWSRGEGNGRVGPAARARAGGRRHGATVDDAGSEHRGRQGAAG
jgi:cytochrome c oxidase cbb3-type subunit 3